MRGMGSLLFYIVIILAFVELHYLRWSCVLSTKPRREVYFTGKTGISVKHTKGRSCYQEFRVSEAILHVK